MYNTPCGFIIGGDDVSVGKKGSLVGRRGLAGQIGSEDDPTMPEALGD